MPFPHYIQHDSMDCGPTCLKMVARYYGRNFSLNTLRERSYINRNGVTMLGISDAAESIGFHTLGVELTFDQLVNEMPLPCIVHWQYGHFVVVYKISEQKFLGKKKNRRVYVADPSGGLIKYAEDEFIAGWISTKKNNQQRGHCLLLEPTPDFYDYEDEVKSKNTIRILYPYIKKHKSLLFQLFLGFVVTSIFSLIVPFLAQSIVDRGISYKDTTFLTVILIAQLAITLGSSSVGFIRGWIMLQLSTRINISLITSFLTKLMQLPISFFDSKVTGDLIQRINDNSRIQNFITSTAVNFLFSCINFIAFSIVIAAYSVKIFITFIIGSIIYVIWIRFFLAYRRVLDNRRFAHMAKNQSNVIQLITGMQDIKMFNCEKQKRWEWEKIQAHLFKISNKGLMINQVQSVGAVLINSSKNFIITYLTAKSVIDGEISLGMMVSIQFIIGQLNGPIESLIGFIQSSQDAKISLERLNEIQDREAEETQIDEKILDLPENRDIYLKNLSYQYEGPRSPFVIKDVTLKIPANKVTAIVGSSGSGKTTLLKFLMGFYTPVSGDIYVDTIPLKSIHSKIWRRAIGSVMQDGFIFSDTIANNIAIGDEVPNKQKLKKAISIANIEEFIEDLPSKYNTKIGNEGSGISQGQKQRVLIARAVYKDPEYIFFDEATNSLDANNERIIMNNLNEFFKGRTVVVVAHRLSTVKNADKIIVLEKGKIVEEGTHSELVGARSYYYNLVKNQLELGG